MFYILKSVNVWQDSDPLSFMWDVPRVLKATDADTDSRFSYVFLNPPISRT